MGRPCPRCAASHRCRSAPPGARCWAKFFPLGCSLNTSSSACAVMCAGSGPRCARVAMRFCFSSAFLARSCSAVPLGAFWKPARIFPMSPGLARRSSASSCFSSAFPRAPPAPVSPASAPRFPPPNPPRCAPPSDWKEPARLYDPSPPGLAPFAGSLCRPDVWTFASSAASCDCEAFFSSLSRPGLCLRSSLSCFTTDACVEGSGRLDALPGMSASPTIFFSCPLRSSMSFLYSAT